MKIADIQINLPTRHLDKPFSYEVPKSLDFALPGCRVMVPFGKQLAEGFIINIRDCDEEDSPSFKVIDSLIDEEPWFDQAMLQCAYNISKYYLCTLAEALRLFVPSKTSIRKKKVYTAAQIDVCPKDSEALSVYLFIQQHPTVSAQILIKHFGTSVQKTLHQLSRQGYILEQTLASRRVGEKNEDYYNLCCENSTVLSELRGTGAKRAISLLIEKGKVSWSEFKQLNISRDTLQRLENREIIKKTSERVWRQAYSTPKSLEPFIRLNEEQQHVCQVLNKALLDHQYMSFLLYGITGSGKTEVYLETVRNVRALGRQALVLVPEIALTGQIVRRFQERFGSDVVVIHSRLSAGEKEDSFVRIKQEQAGIVIGARSAVFAPAPNIGLIILDEEHEFTYKQEERPRYHARQVATFRLQQTKGILLSGSATPDICSYYVASNQPSRLLTLTRRAAGSLPEVKVVDMCQEFKEKRLNVLSAPLRNLIAETIARQEQVVILLNRRGYATFVLCRECGHVMKCPHCDVSLVYHAVGHKMCCHYCDHTIQVPDLCPACQSRYIRYFGTGTQKVEEELNEYFPQARILRMDQDTTGKKFAHERMMKDFAKHQYDILLGTQMVAKGHDIRNITAVGILAIDTVLNLPDFRSAERAFSLITQAAGRAGRGDKRGKVIVQTYNASHYAVLTGSEQNYESFYHAELELRRQLMYPPFTQLIKITLQGKDEKALEKKAQILASSLSQLVQKETMAEVIGPYAASIARLKDLFRMQILIKGKNLSSFKKYLFEKGFWQDDQILIDIDPMNML